MNTVDPKLCHVRDLGPTHYTVWASDLGWRAGDWPQSIDFGGIQLFRGEPVTRDNDLVSYTYSGQEYSLLVFND